MQNSNIQKNSLIFFKKSFNVGMLKDGSKYFFKPQPFSDTQNIPDSTTAACSLLYTDILKRKEIIAIKHKNRGWDIPGGHREKNEDLINTLKREVKEEANVSINFIKPLVLLESNKDLSIKTFIAIFACNGFIEKFEPSEEVTDRQIMSITNFLERYEGNKELMQKI